MVTKCLLSTLFLMVLAMSGMAGQAGAIPISIINPGFEDPILADGERTHTTFTAGWRFYWDGSPVSGVWNPSAAQAYGGIAPEGQNVAYDNGQSTTILAQTLGVVLAPNTTYTLQALVASYHNPFTFLTRRYTIGLSGGVTMPGLNLLARCDTCVPPLDGTFSPVTVTYTSGAAVMAETPLSIVLLANGAGGEINWDQVTLDASTVPEPASLWLLACGVVGVLALVGRGRCARP